MSHPRTLSGLREQFELVPTTQFIAENMCQLQIVMIMIFKKQKQKFETKLSKILQFNYFLLVFKTLKF